MSLVELADYKTALGLSSDQDKEDAKLTQYSLEIDDKLKAYLGFNIEEEVYYDEIYNGNGSQRLFPRNVPVTEITKLEVYQGLDSGGDEDWEEWTQNDEYGRLSIQSGGFIIYMDTKFPQGMQNIRLNYTAGYTTETLPQDIAAVCKELMVIKYQRLDKKMMGLTSKSRNEGGASSTITYEDLEEKTLKKIEHYRFTRI